MTDKVRVRFAPSPTGYLHLAKAQAFLSSRSGSGGPEMMKAIRASLDPSDAQGHIRIVCFMTVRYVAPMTTSA